MADKDILQIIISSTASKDVDSDEEWESNISWDQTINELNALKFSDSSHLLNDVKIMNFHIIQNDFLKKKTYKKFYVWDLFRIACTSKPPL